MKPAPPPSNGTLGVSEPWSLEADDVLTRLQSNATSGLTAEEATRRHQQQGPNALPEEPEPGLLRRAWSQLRDVTVLALLVAACLAALMTTLEGDGPPSIARYTDSLAILLIVILNAAIGLVQEGRARSALRALRDLNSPCATVMRARAETVVPASELVVGDVLVLNEGDRVPADARLLHVDGLAVGEASLTGESAAISKRVEPVSATTALAERLNMLFMSSLVQSGTALAIVTAIGRNTELGGIATMLSAVEKERTPLEIQMDRFGKRVVIGCGVLSVLVFALGLWRLDASVGFSLLVAVSLAVAAIPEGLPAITTVVLALGVRAMATKNAIVRKLSAVEALGSIHVICSDKTGTLTQNRMTVRRVFVAGEELDADDLGAELDADDLGAELDADDLGAKLDADDLGRTEKPHRDESDSSESPASRLVHSARFVPHAHTIGSGEAAGEPTDRALLEFHLRYKTRDPSATIVGTLAFSSERKRSSVVVESQRGAKRLICHGAPEVVLRRATSWLTKDGRRPLSDETRSSIDETVQRLSSSGLRVLAVAERDLDDEFALDEQLENDLVLIGLVGMSDPPRPEVAEAIERARSGGIRTLMITGDHPRTAEAIARELGILRPDGEIVTGDDLATLSETQLENRAPHIDVIARATPRDKLLVVKALTRLGLSVAMTGDGVNDAPAIKAATVGVAMGKNGTDAAREVADLVLADDNYATLVSAVEQGRAIHRNIQRFIAFLFAANLGLVVVVLFGLLMHWPALLTPTQILWINLVTNGAPALALGIEPHVADTMKSPPLPADAPLLDKSAWISVATNGIWMGACGLLVFWLTLPTHELSHRRSLVFCVLAFAPLVHAFSARADRGITRTPLFGNRFLWAAIGASVLLQLVAIYAPFARVVFGTAMLHPSELGIAVLVACSVLLPAEALRLLVRRSHGVHEG